jgi:hypothetical protein
VVDVLAGIAGLIGLSMFVLYRKDSVFDTYSDDLNRPSHRIKEGVRDEDVYHYAVVRGAGWALIGASAATLIKYFS